MPQITQENQYDGDTTANISKQKTLLLTLFNSLEWYTAAAPLPALLCHCDPRSLRCFLTPMLSSCWVGTTNWWDLYHVFAHHL